MSATHKEAWKRQRKPHITDRAVRGDTCKHTNNCEEERGKKKKTIVARSMNVMYRMTSLYVISSRRAPCDILPYSKMERKQERGALDSKEQCEGSCMEEGHMTGGAYLPVSSLSTG